MTSDRRIETLELVRSSLGRAAHVVTKDPSQLAAQFLARVGAEQSPALARLVGAASSWRGALWLRPRTASLLVAGDLLRFTLTGHDGPVDAPAVTTDGRIALTGDLTGRVKVWDLELGRELHTLTGHTSSVTAIAVADDGRTAVSGSSDRTVRVWDLETGSARHVLPGHPTPLFTVAVTRDGCRAASGCRKTMRVWDLELGVELGSVRHRGNGLDVAIDPGAHHAICQGKGRKAIVRLRLEDGARVPPIPVGRADRYFRALTADARTALTGDDGVLTTWDVRTGARRHEYREHRASIQGLVVTPDGSHAATASSDCTARVWDLRNREAFAVVTHPAQVRGVALTPDASLAVTAAQDGVVRVWDLTRAHGAAGHASPDAGGHHDAGSLAMSRDGRLLATTGGAEIRIWDVGTCAVVTSLPEAASHVAFAGKDRLLSASADDDPTISVWSLATREVLARWTARTPPFQRRGVASRGVWAIAADPAGRVALTTAHDLSYRLWDVGSGEQLWVGQGRVGLSDEGMSAAFTPDGRRVLIGLWSGRVRIVDLADPDMPRGFDWHVLDEQDFADRSDPTRLSQGTTALISDLAVDGAGGLAVTASADRTARVWHVSSGACLRVLGHPAAVRGASISDDGMRVATAGTDLTLRLWDAASGVCLAAFTGDAPFVHCLVTPGGSDVVATDAARNLHFLRVEEPARTAGSGQALARPGHPGPGPSSTNSA